MRKLSMEELNRISAEEFKLCKKISVCFVLDNIRSANNVGSVFRTSDAFRVEKIHLCGITATPPNRDIQKTALGATDTVDWEYHKDTPTLIKQLKDEGWITIAIEQAEGSTLLHEFKPDKDVKYCFILGHEVYGVADEVIASSDICLEIPQFGTKHSFNVSVTAGMVLWDYVSKSGVISSLSKDL